MYIPADVRKFLQFKIVVLRIYDKSLIIEPIEDDSIEALNKFGKEKLKRKSIETLKDVSVQKANYLLSLGQSLVNAR